MNFFEYQEQARRMTVRLIILYAASLLLVFAAIHLLVAAIVGNVTGEIRQDNASSYSPPSSDPFDLTLYAFRDPLLLLIDLSAVTLIIGGGTLYKISELKRLDGDGIASHLGGKRLTKTPDVPWRERRLLNIVEEMAIAAGINTPNVYILRGEQSINAFAAGFSLPTSVVAVTQGAVEYLTRDELQGVIGHEFSHILNQDTRLNMKLIGILFGLEMLAIFGYIAMRIGMEISFYAPRTSRKNDDSQSAVLGFALACFAVGLILLLIGLIGQLFANIIRAAISRQREYCRRTHQQQQRRGSVSPFHLEHIRARLLQSSLRLTSQSDGQDQTARAELRRNLSAQHPKGDSRNRLSRPAPRPAVPNRHGAAPERDGGAAGGECRPSDDCRRRRDGRSSRSGRAETE